MTEEKLPSAADMVPAGGGGGGDLPVEFSVDVDGEVFNVKVASVMGKMATAEKSAQPVELPPGAVTSPMQGMILSVKVNVGDKVETGDVVMTIEAMKMQNDVKSTHSGVVKEIITYQGEVVNNGDLLMVLEPDDE